MHQCDFRMALVIQLLNRAKDLEFMETNDVRTRGTRNAYEEKLKKKYN